VGNGGSSYNSGGGASGVVRIVWPGFERQWPSTDVSTLTSEVYN
jgi:hypothetical protein